MRYSFFLFVILFFTKSFAQQDSLFNYNYPLPNNIQYNSMGMVMVDSSYYLYGGTGRTTLDCEYARIGHHLTKINYNGSRDTTLILDSCGYLMYSGWEGSLISYHDTLFLLEVNHQ